MSSRSHPARRVLLLLAVLAAVSLFSVPASQAGTYRVFPCSGHVPKALVFEEVNERQAFSLNDDCELNGGDLVTLIGENTRRNTSGNENVEWSFEVPSFANLLEVSFDQSYRGPWDQSITGATTVAWAVLADSIPLEDFGNGSQMGTTPSDGRRTYLAGTEYSLGTFDTKAKQFRVRLECVHTECATNAEGVTATSKAIKVVLTDSKAPGIGSPGGLLLAGVPVHGTQEVKAFAVDGDSGLHFGEVVIDGRQAYLMAADSKGGQCQEPFFSFVPCSNLLQGLSQAVDTALLSDGKHEVRLVACDATVAPVLEVVHLADPNCATLTPPLITVRNAPVLRSPPVVSGSAKVGSPLAATPGEWENLTSHQLAFAYQWLRCPQDGSECTPIDFATANTYTPVAADVGARDEVRVFATVQATGQASSSSISAPSDVVVKPPETGEPGTVPPIETRITKHPRKRTAVRIASFHFIADQPGARFECKLDQGPFKPCNSPFKHRVKRGRHSFQVRAVGAAGVPDPKPALFRWRVF